LKASPSAAKTRYAKTNLQINAMLRISVEEAATTLKALLAQVALGEEIVLVEQDQEVARLVPSQTKNQWLVKTRALRTSLNVQGESLSETVIRERQGERF
jgi:antitoxin (DNA-binding transcriptional repressor) of toxin-antitoxin stability system